MNIRHRIFFSALVAATMVISMTACGGKPFKYRPIHEIPEGPGVLTDRTDGTVLYDSKGKGVLQSVGNRPKGQKVSETKKTVITADESVDSNQSDFKEFEEYRQWKKWRKDSKNSAEYQEFIEWRQEWKSYQEWKRQQPKSK